MWQYELNGRKNKKINMKKIKLLLLIPFLSAFTKAVTPKAVSPLLATGGIFLSFLESKSQTPLTKEMADTMYKPINYIPTMQTFGFNVGFDNSGIYYPAARPDYRFDIDVLPILGAVAYSSLYNDLIFRPDLNHLPNYYEIGYCDTAFLWKKDMGYGLKMVLNKIITDTASTNGIMSKDRANAAITAINNNISNKLDKTETITINGTSRTYSSNPVFSIPTVTNTNQLVNGSNYLTSEVDGSITNEIQLLSGSGTKTITLSNSGGNFVIPNVTSTEINTALGGVPITTLTANQIYTALTYTPLSNTYTPIDNSITNEIQTLSGSGTNTISLSSGGTFVLPSTVSQTLSVNG